MYKELLALSPEALHAKYLEVFGTAAEGLNKQAMASAIAKALTTNADTGADNSTAAEGLNKQAMVDANTVQLEKLDAKGKVIDTMTLPKATWNNLPAGQKKEWKLKEPAELKTANDADN